MPGPLVGGSYRRVPNVCPDLLCSTWNPDEDFSKKYQKKAATKVRVHPRQGYGSSCDLPLYRIYPMVYGENLMTTPGLIRILVYEINGKEI